ncbi:MAG: hypothetical protein IJB95_04155, partial [Clostridia bacterium]|nr:hypothetical protein [Clostridia bacterium]
MAKQDVEYKVADCGALVLDRKYVFWITKTGDSPEFTVFLENAIDLTRKEFKSVTDKFKILKQPFIRGPVNFVEQMLFGYKC